MILDTQTLFSGAIAADGTRSSQAITATGFSTNVLDRAGNTVQFATLEDEGVNPNPWLVVQVDAAFNNLTSLTIDLVSADNAALSTNLTVHYSKTVALAGLTAATRLVAVQIPSDDYRRYIGVRYTVAGTAPSAGSVYAFFTMDVQSNRNYASGFTVDA